MNKFFKKINKVIDKEWKSLLIKFFILLSCYIVFMLIDRLTKEYVFSENDYINRFPMINWKIIGFRPTLNNGSAFSTNVGKYTFLQTIGILITVITIFSILFKIKIKFLIPIFLVGAGSLGNVIDRFIYYGNVRDLIYFPWWDNYPTFNFADVFIVINAIILITFIFIELLHDRKKEVVV